MTNLKSSQSTNSLSFTIPSLQFNSVDLYLFNSFPFEYCRVGYYRLLGGCCWSKSYVCHKFRCCCSSLWSVINLSREVRSFYNCMFKSTKELSPSGKNFDKIVLFFQRRTFMLIVIIVCRAMSASLLQVAYLYTPEVCYQPIKDN